MTFLLISMMLSKNTYAQNWSALGTGLPLRVNALCIYNGEIYTGDYQGVRRWDGNNWFTVGTVLGGSLINGVYALEVYNEVLYAAGSFTTINGVSANRIAKWDGTTWSPVGTGLIYHVAALKVYNGELYAGGTFWEAGGISANKIAKWNGTVWSVVGSGMNDAVYALAIYNGHLYAGGAFTIAGGNQAFRIAKWDGFAWSSVNLGMFGGTNYPFVASIAVYNGELYAGGMFSNVGELQVVAKNLAKFNGTTWSATGLEVGGGASQVTSLGVCNGKLIAGGFNISAGDLPASHILVWDESTWATLGSGVDNIVLALLEHNSEMYVGGVFSTADGIMVNRIAKWTSCDAPSTPGAITGNTTVCNGSNQNYSVLPVAGATDYNWVFPSGWTGNSTTNSISAVVGNSGGNIYVNSRNSCGYRPSQRLAVTVLPTASPGTVTGLSPLNIGETANFTTTGTSGGTWSSSNTSVATVDQNGTVYAVNGGASVISYTVINCGNAESSSFTLTVNTIRCGHNNEKYVVCHNGNEICIAESAVPAHLAHGDYLGSCNGNNASRGETEDIRIEEGAKPGFNIYPNPSHNQITIRSDKLLGKLTIYDVSGKIVYQKLIKDKQTVIDVKSFPTGVYYLRSDQSVKAIKFVKQ